MLMTGVSLWSFFYAAELLSTNLSQMIFWAKIEYFWIVSIPPAWLYFAFSFQPAEKLRNPKTACLILIIPALVLLAVWTNEFHHLFWTQNKLFPASGMFFMKNSYGPFFWVHFIYSYLLILVGTILLFYRFIITDPLTRYRFIYWLIPFFPLIGNALSVIKLTPFQHLDLTPLGFTISGFILFWGGTRRFQLEVIPIAREVIMDNIEDGLIITDHQGTVIDFNPAVFQITGLKTNHQIQAFLLDGFIDRMRNSGASQLELDVAFPRPHVLIRITPIHGRKGLAGWVVMLTDITDQKEAARELEESKERYERIFREMRDAIFVRNFNGEILDANPAACEMYGYPREELAGKTIQDLMLENTALLITAENIDLGMIFESPDHLLQTLSYRSNGEMFPVELRECPVIISGETVFLVVVRDVTEKVKAESALKSMNETLEHRIRERTEELRLAYDATIEGWAKALELREKETAGHSERTVAKALTLARRLGLGGEQLEHIRRGALLHDIGKMVVPDHILQKPGSLTAEER
ncbi:MAG TPA: histidine kinase N-terminal 7TM domain-containing protein, partial [Bacillota bacterium]|nr:histidine kinase N-terminal 7TM domain-containing protein [Bacillota bacterium]